jgi:SAM-dependent methyltransferase
MSGIDARSYWEDRLGRNAGAEGVGHAGLGEGFNGWLYRVRREVFLREVGPRVKPAPRVLDIGSGAGFYVERWHELGASRVTGSDIAEVAVERLRARFPADTFVRLDIGAPLERSVRFDAVSAVDVVFHLLDEQTYRRGFANLFDLLVPGGLLVFSENFLHGEALRLPHQVSRTLTEIESVVRGTGFEILARRPLFFLMNQPHDSTSRLHRLWWRGLAGCSARSETFGRVAGATLFPLERALVARRAEGPSTELMICRKPEA